MFDFLSLLSSGAANPALNRLMQPFANGQPDQMQRQAPPLPPPIEVGPAPRAVPTQQGPDQAASVVPGSLAPPMAQQPQSQPEKSDGLSGFFASDRGQALNDLFLGMAMGKTPQESLSLGGVMMAQNGRDRRAKNETVDWLQKKGLDAETAKQLAANPKSLQEYLTNMLAPKNGKDHLIGAGGSIYDTQTGQWLTPPAGAGRQTEYGLNLVYGKDANGKTVAYQLSKDGSSKPFNPGDGVELTPGVSQVDTGTGTILVDNKTGLPVNQINKDVAGAANQAASGKNVAEAANTLPAVETAANYAISTIDSLSNDPYLPNMLGPWNSKTPNVRAEAHRVQGKMDQVQGQAFLQAFNTLRGGGAITEIEGQKATQAIARLNAAQSEADYKQALGELRGIVQQGLENVRKRAGIAPQTAPAPAPQGGVVDYKQYFGGN